MAEQPTPAPQPVTVPTPMPEIWTTIAHGGRTYRVRSYRAISEAEAREAVARTVTPGAAGTDGAAGAAAPGGPIEVRTSIGMQSGPKPGG